MYDTRYDNPCNKIKNVSEVLQVTPTDRHQEFDPLSNEMKWREILWRMTLGPPISWGVHSERIFCGRSTTPISEMGAETTPVNINKK